MVTLRQLVKTIGVKQTHLAEKYKVSETVVSLLIKHEKVAQKMRTYLEKKA